MALPVRVAPSLGWKLTATGAEGSWSGACRSIEQTKRCIRKHREGIGTRAWVCKGSGATVFGGRFKPTGDAITGKWNVLCLSTLSRKSAKGLGFVLKLFGVWSAHVD